MASARAGGAAIHSSDGLENVPEVSGQAEIELICNRTDDMASWWDLTVRGLVSDLTLLDARGLVQISYIEISWSFFKENIIYSVQRVCNAVHKEKQIKLTNNIERGYNL